MAEPIHVDLIKTGGRMAVPGTGRLDHLPTVPGTAPGDPTAARPQFTPPGAAPPASTPAEPARPAYRHPDPPAADVRAFVQALAVRGELFSKTVGLFGGLVTVTFRALTAAAAEDLRLQSLADLAALGGITAAGAAAAMEKQSGWRLAKLVHRLQVGPVKHEDDPAAAPAAALAALLAACGSWAVYNAVMSAAVDFDRLTAAIEERAADPSFFSATGPGGSSPAPPSAAAG